MQCVKKYMSKIEEVIAIMDKHSLETTDIKKILKEVKYFRVTSPVIGNFSTGKSSLINAVIGKRILSVDITPETAVATEIYYGNNRVLKYTINNEKPEELSIDTLPLKNLTVANTELVKIEYDSDFLQDIINVKLVDLPGFDSGIELHNKAIDRYISNSLAYILAIAVDEPVLKENIEGFLNELELHEMPLYVVLTKSARISDDEINACKNLVDGIIRKIITTSDVKIGVCESYGNVKVDDLKNFLYEIQDNAVKIFEQKYSEILTRKFRNIETYFEDQLNKRDMNLSELEVERQELSTGIYELLGKLAKEKESFENQMEDCITAIRNKIYGDLEISLSGLSAMIQNGKDVNDRVNTIVRNAVAIGIKTEFEPRLQKYLKKISSMISIDIMNDEGIKTNVDQILSENRIYDTTRMVLPFALAGVGVVFGPLGITIGALVGTFIDSAMNISQSKIKENKATQAAQKIIDTVSGQASEAVANEIRSYFEKINTDMEDEIFKQKELLDKSLEDVEMRLNIETNEQTKQIREIEQDLESIREIIRSIALDSCAN